MDETYIKVAGHWKYLYRAVDRAGDTVDFLLTAKRDMAAARRFLECAINLHDVPEKIAIDESGTNTAAIESGKADACVDILMLQSKYLNSMARQAIAPSNGSLVQCWVSSHSGVPALSLPASRPCT